MVEWAFASAAGRIGVAEIVWGDEAGWDRAPLRGGMVVKAGLAARNSHTDHEVIAARDGRSCTNCF